MNLNTPFPTAGAVSPCLVVSLPFDPGMTRKGDLDLALKDAQMRVARQLLEKCPKGIAETITDRLQHLIFGLNYSSHKKSLALFISATTAKAMYLNEVVDPQMIVDKDFRIRNLTTAAGSRQSYLALLISGGQSRIYQGGPGGLQLVKTEAFGRMEACYRKMEEDRLFVSQGGRKEALLEKFLYHIDEVLSATLDVLLLPVFVFAGDAVVTLFSRITRNDRQVAAYIHKDGAEAGEDDLMTDLRPYLQNWDAIGRQMALKQIDIAREAGKLICGIDAVSKALRSPNSRMLIVEEGFSVPYAPLAESSRTPFYIQDRVDALIEIVLDQGGQVEWVGRGQIRDLGHIALVRYY